MSATEKLRALLDERGVEYSTKDSAFRDITYWPASNRVVASYSCSKYSETENGMFKTQFTPEQAIAATLGRGECEMVTSGTPCEGNTDKACTACGAYNIGEFYNEQSHRAVPNYCPNCGRRVKKGGAR